MRNTQKNLLRLAIVIAAFLILFSACSPAKQQIVLPTPEASKGHVTGTILTLDGKPYSDYSVRLAEVYWQGEQGAYVLDESFSPGAISDKNGAFQVLNAPEGEYVLILGQAMQTYQAVTDANGILMRVTVKAGETVDLGTIKFDYVP